MTTDINPTAPVLKHILHPTDLSKGTDFAFAHALALAVGGRATLDIVHVDQRAHVMDWAEFPDATKTLQRWGVLPEGDGDLGTLLEGFEVKKVAAYGTEPIGPLVEYLEESLADLVVLATHQQEGLARWLHREVAQRIIRKRPTMSLFIPFGISGFVSATTGEVSLRHALVPIDWNPTPQASIDALDAVARTLGLEELEVTVFNVGDDQREIPPIVKPDHPGWKWSERLAQGDVVEQILKATEELDSDLVVMATQGRDGFLDALRGSHTERVLRHARCPVLSVPGTEI